MRDAKRPYFPDVQWDTSTTKEEFLSKLSPEIREKWGPVFRDIKPNDFVTIKNGLLKKICMELNISDDSIKNIFGQHKDAAFLINDKTILYLKFSRKDNWWGFSKKRIEELKIRNMPLFLGFMNEKLDAWFIPHNFLEPYLQYVTTTKDGQYHTTIYVNVLYIHYISNRTKDVEEVIKDYYNAYHLLL